MGLPLQQTHAAQPHGIFMGWGIANLLGVKLVLVALAAVRRQAWVWIEQVCVCVCIDVSVSACVHALISLSWVRREAAGAPYLPLNAITLCQCLTLILQVPQEVMAAAQPGRPCCLLWPLSPLSSTPSLPLQQQTRDSRSDSRTGRDTAGSDSKTKWEGVVSAPPVQSGSEQLRGGRREGEGSSVFVHETQQEGASKSGVSETAQGAERTEHQGVSAETAAWGNEGESDAEEGSSQFGALRSFVRSMTSALGHGAVSVMGGVEDSMEGYRDEDETGVSGERVLSRSREEEMGSEGQQLNRSQQQGVTDSEGGGVRDAAAPVPQYSLPSHSQGHAMDRADDKQRVLQAAWAQGRVRCLWMMGGAACRRAEGFWTGDYGCLCLCLLLFVFPFLVATLSN